MMYGITSKVLILERRVVRKEFVQLSELLIKGNKKLLKEKKKPVCKVD